MKNRTSILLILILFVLLYFLFKPDRSYPKILNLILYSETTPEYIEMYKLLSVYLKKQNKIKYYFYAYNPNINDEYIIKDDIIYIKGEESLVPGCLDKTLKAFEICKDLDFDYIIRTNISEVVDFNLLNELLKNNKIEYGGATTLNLFWFDHPSGINDTRYFGTNFVRGNCIIFNREIFDLILNSTKQISGYNVVDDVAFGLFCQDNSIYITGLGEKNVFGLYNSNYFDEKTVFYRNKNQDNRKIDVENIKNITNNISLKYQS